MTAVGSTEASVKLCVLLEDPLGGSLKLTGWLAQKIHDGRSGEFLRTNSEAACLFPEPLTLGWG